MENIQQNAEASKADVQTLLIADKTDKKVYAVSKIKKKGAMETVPAEKKNSSQFIRLDRHGDLFSNFFSNFMNQHNNPTRFSFFIVPKHMAAELASTILKVLDKIPKLLPLNEIQIPFIKNEQILNYNTMETQQKSQEAGEFRYSPEQVNWSALDAMGVNVAKLENSKLMEQLLKGYKTSELVPLNLSIGNAVIRMDARLSLQPNEQGDIVVAMHGIRKEPNLNYPFFGHEFTSEDKDNLLKTGNMGRVVELYNQKTAEYHPSLISVDRMTNELSSVRTEWVRIPDEIKGVKLDEQQKQQLTEGKPIYLEGMLSKKGEPFDSNVQYNADKRYVEFLFDRSAAAKQDHSQNLEAPRTVRRKELNDAQYAKFKDGQPIYLSGLLNKQGKEYEGYLSFDKESGKTNFSFTNPDPAKEKVQQKAASENPAQAQQQEQSQEPAKGRGRKM